MESRKVLSFYNFLNESKSETTKVVVLTGNVKGSKTSKSFVEECEKRGVECVTIDVNDAVIEKVTMRRLRLDEIIISTRSLLDGLAARERLKP